MRKLINKIQAGIHTESKPIPKKEGGEMKTSTVGFVLAAILMVVAGVGFGIAQAGGNQEFVPEDNWSGTDWQTGGPVEIGSLPAEGNADFDPFSRGVADVAQARGPVETGSMPAESNAEFDPFSRGGS
jgi:hypothetical protein